MKQASSAPSISEDKYKQRQIEHINRYASYVKAKNTKQFVQDFSIL